MLRFQSVRQSWCNLWHILTHYSFAQEIYYHAQYVSLFLEHLLKRCPKKNWNFCVINFLVCRFAYFFVILLIYFTVCSFAFLFYCLLPHLLITLLLWTVCPCCSVFWIQIQSNLHYFFAIRCRIRYVECFFLSSYFPPPPPQ